MNRIRKFFKIFLLVLLIILASLGVGLAGGIPIPSASRKRQEIVIEKDLPEDRAIKKDTKELK